MERWHGCKVLVKGFSKIEKVFSRNGVVSDQGSVIRARKRGWRQRVSLLLVVADPSASLIMAW